LHGDSSYTALDSHPAADPTLISGVYVRQMLAGTLPHYTPPATSEDSSDSNN